MGLIANGSRSILLEEADYRWTVSEDGDGLWHVANLKDAPGRLRMAWFSMSTPTRGTRVASRGGCPSLAPSAWPRGIVQFAPDREPRGAPPRRAGLFRTTDRE